MLVWGIDFRDYFIPEAFGESLAWAQSHTASVSGDGGREERAKRIAEAKVQR